MFLMFFNVLIKHNMFLMFLYILGKIKTLVF